MHIGIFICLNMVCCDSIGFLHELEKPFKGASLTKLPSPIQAVWQNSVQAKTGKRVFPKVFRVQSKPTKS